MRLSSKERTSLRAMAELARRYGQGPISLTDVAATEGLQLPYLERIAMDLRKAGLLVSVRGAHGVPAGREREVETESARILDDVRERLALAESGRCRGRALPGAGHCPRRCR